MIPPAQAALLLDRGERRGLKQRAGLLAWGGNAWHVVEFAIAGHARRFWSNGNDQAWPMRRAGA